MPHALAWGFADIKFSLARFLHVFRKNRDSGCRALTLIELLIVIAIIAILAASAVAVLFNTSDRAKAGHAQNELVLIQNALDAYKVEYNALPPNVVQYGKPLDMVRNGAALWRLTTPVSYISYSSLEDPFPLKGDHHTHFGYWLASPSSGPAHAIILSPGPNGVVDSSIQSGNIEETKAKSGEAKNFQIIESLEYDPTNGTRSPGDVVLQL